MEYAIAICDDDNIMAEKLSVSFKNEFLKAGRTDISIDYYSTAVKEIPFAYLYILQNCYSEYKPNFRINVYTFFVLW